MMAITLTLIILLTYTLAMIISNRSVPYSLSGTFYETKNKWAFVSTMLATGLLLLMPMIESAPASWTWLAYLTCGGFLAVGATPDFKSKRQGTVHAIGAVTLLLTSQVWVALVQPAVLWLWMAYIVYTLVSLFLLRRIFIDTKPMFWVEVTAVLSLMIALL